MTAALRSFATKGAEYGVVFGVNKAESINFRLEKLTLYLQAGGKLVESGRLIMWDGGCGRHFWSGREVPLCTSSSCFKKHAGKWGEGRLVTDVWGPRCGAHSAVFF